ncbi:hypothetical protein HQ584_07860 [Patescibacteria group bacterium]|nr:hypothetical protein [Patescibacteria group bacterium]
MANKTTKQIKRRLEQFYKFRSEALRRNPRFLKDCEAWVKFDSRRYNEHISDEERERIEIESFKIKLGILERYQIGLLTDPRKPDLYAMCCSAACNYPAESYYDFIKKTEKGYPGGLIGLMRNEPQEITKHILRDNRFLTIQVDMYRDLEVVLQQVKELIKGMKNEMKKYGLLRQLDKSPHLDNYPRYFAVWDLVQKRKQLWPFERIAEKLNADGWYKNQTIKQATALARQDYRTACKAIGVPVKGKENVSKKVMRPIIKLKMTKQQREMAAEWEGKLAAFKLGLDEFTTKQDYLRHNPTDGPTKQKLKSVRKIGANVAKRLNDKRKENLRRLLK